MAELSQIFAQQPWLVWVGGALLGLSVGSFLNVVIHRMPLMLERQWKRECRELLELEAEQETRERFNLIVPRSRCPHCGHRIGALENIPLLSWLWLRGRCRACREPIGLQYPMVELFTALLTLLVLWRLGPTAQALAAMLFTWTLIALSGIDLKIYILPDNITLPLLWLGLLLNWQGLYTSLDSALLGAVAGYLSLWLLYHGFRLLTGKEGMGYGDFKLFAAIGAWLGWQMLPLVIILAAVAGAVIGIGLIVLRGRDRAQPIPFGPFLAIGGWVALMWGEEITRSYLRSAGILY
ncbi:MAG TPA: prepilin peptidase [Chromatiales bacterium]|nr:prepilin peptidase [Chromatiales bacterium]